MSITAKPSKPKNIKGGPPQKKNPLLDKRVLLALLLLLLLGGLAYSYWPNNKLAQVRNNQAKWENMSDEEKKNLTKEQREQLWAQHQLLLNSLTPDQKIQWSREREAKSNEEIRKVLAMPPEERRAWLDADIKKEQDREVEREEMKQQIQVKIDAGMDPDQARREVFSERFGIQFGQGWGGPPGGPNGSGNPNGQGSTTGAGGPSGPGGRGGPPSQQDSEQRTRAFLANTTSEGRALRFDLNIERQRRQAELHIPLTSSSGPRMSGGGSPGSGRGPGGGPGGPGGGRP